ncbi:hypothetical protein NLX83_34475 [Allokutzneria sp. A3M-2-11 16]|uniref:hypothetical protein n=1 Tax=Allokutzneria sp. A3M-2-11 16 TaxID=2962043 RepID=UPI0020B8E99B|nr:hypothetical protein [Allokutzneria sp. A3M-2-11 16]MCP3804386.1 hypothetical protein [Allokutzneria sp. A3M-2-11 16]
MARASVLDTLRVATTALLPITPRGADKRLVHLLQRLRDKYGDDRLQLRVPGRSFSLVLSREDVHRVLSDAVSCTPANVEKEISPEVGPLDWDGFATMWWRLVRRIVLGDSAADDSRITARLKSLRENAKWSYFHRKHAEHREIFLRDIRSYVDRAEPGSLAERIAQLPKSADVRPESQVAHWLFAFDAAGMATFRTLALLASHPSIPRDQDHLRASVLESLRLWPTTPLVLRDSTVDGSTLLIPAPFCPERDLVLFVAAKALSTLFLEHDFLLTSHPQLANHKPLPEVLNPLGLRFAVTARTVDEVPVG